MSLIITSRSQSPPAHPSVPSPSLWGLGTQQGWGEKAQQYPSTVGFTQAGSGPTKASSKAG